MTYDISLYPRRPGQDWAEVVAADEVEGPGMDQAQLDTGVATFRRIEARLREQLTEPVQVWVAEETDGDVLGELTATDSGLQVELYDRSASVSFPARERADRETFHQLVRQAVRIVADETGYEAYDPQTGRTYDGLMDEAVADDGSPAGGATGTTGATVVGDNDGAQADTTGTAGVQPRLDPRADPRMLRRRGWVYLVIGFVLGVIGVLRWTDGDRGWFTWIILAIAAFDLLGGQLMLSMARQLQSKQDDASLPPTTPTA